jgi:hypothetical protein
MRRFVKGLAACGAALVVAMTPTAAAWADPGGNSGWVPLQTPPFNLAAGEVCSFELQGDIVYDHEFTRVVETFPDGSPKVQEFQGALGVHFTNVDTGESTQRDVSGTLRATFHEEGGVDFQFQGNGLAAIPAGNPTYPPGVYVVSGSVLFVVHADGSREFTTVNGTLENMCQTLA